MMLARLGEGVIARPTRSSPTSKTFGRAIGCGHAIAVRSTPSWREMDSNPRSRFTYSPFRTPFLSAP
jgi:hypothetical protein